MRDTEGMQRPSRFKQPRLLRRDWIGDAVLTLVCGAVLVASIFLPWVNEDGRGWVNFSLRGGKGIYGVLRTHWGAPALLLALTVVVVAFVMLLFTPGRRSWLLGVLVAALGVAVFGVAQDAAAHIGWLDPGIGMYLTTLIGVLLVPIGLAAALVARFLSRAERADPEAPAARPDAAVQLETAAPADVPAPLAPTGPPAPESAPPS